MTIEYTPVKGIAVWTIVFASCYGIPRELRPFDAGGVLFVERLVFAPHFKKATAVALVKFIPLIQRYVLFVFLHFVPFNDGLDSFGGYCFAALFRILNDLPSRL